MLQFRIVLLLSVFYLSSCLHKKQDDKFIDSKHHQANFKVFGNYELCDSCKTIVLVSHSNCSFSEEVNIESGTLLIPHRIIDKFKNSLLKDSVSRNRATVNSVYDFQTRSIVRNQVVLNTSKIHLKNFSNFPPPASEDYFQTFKLIGNVVEIKRKVFVDGSIDSLYSVWLSVDSIIKTDKIKICGN